MLVILYMLWDNEINKNVDPLTADPLKGGEPLDSEHSKCSHMTFIKNHTQLLPHHCSNFYTYLYSNNACTDGVSLMCSSFNNTLDPYKVLLPQPTANAI